MPGFLGKCFQLHPAFVQGRGKSPPKQVRAPGELPADDPGLSYLLADSLDSAVQDVVFDRPGDVSSKGFLSPKEVIGRNRIPFELCPEVRSSGFDGRGKQLLLRKLPALPDEPRRPGPLVSAPSVPVLRASLPQAVPPNLGPAAD